MLFELAGRCDKITEKKVLMGWDKIMWGFVFNRTYIWNIAQNQQILYSSRLVAGNDMYNHWKSSFWPDLVAKTIGNSLFHIIG